MGPNVQSGKTRWDQTSSLAKMAWDQMSMGPIVWLPYDSVGGILPYHYWLSFQGSSFKTCCLPLVKNMLSPLRTRVMLSNRFLCEHRDRRGPLWARPLVVSPCISYWPWKRSHGFTLISQQTVCQSYKNDIRVWQKVGI